MQSRTRLQYALCRSLFAIHCRYQIFRLRVRRLRINIIMSVRVAAFLCHLFILLDTHECPEVPEVLTLAGQASSVMGRAGLNREFVLNLSLIHI